MQTKVLLLFINTVMQLNYASEIFKSFILYKFYFLQFLTPVHSYLKVQIKLNLS